MKKVTFQDRKERLLELIKDGAWYRWSNSSILNKLGAPPNKNYFISNAIDALKKEGYIKETI